jgi:glycosyltransferase involved in cell wall biosynthesis
VVADATAAGISHVPWADVFERFRHWDAFVLPSRSDPFPLSMLEAMASGLPVVGTRRDGIAEQITNGTGLLVEPEDPAALADAIAWMASQPASTRRRMGDAARGRVTASFTLEHHAAAMDEAYRATLANRAAA